MLGLLTGVLSGALGVGGAIISTPGIRALGVPALIAIGTTLPSIVPAAVSGGLRYGREGLIDWGAAAFTIPLGMVGAVGGALLSQVVPGEGHLLQLMTAGLLGLSAWRTFRGAGPEAGEDPPGGGGPPGGASGCRAPGRFVGVGLVAGGLSGLLGIGGGLVLVPGLNQVAGLGLRTSVATSLVCVGAFAVPGTIAHGMVGNIDWRVALLLAVTVVPGARLGAAASLRLGERRLAQTVGAFLGLIAVVYAAGEVAALA
ncbi:MAG: sulfite exporter TauE/SafE family protein [Acidimicrobiales bacterium]